MIEYRDRLLDAMKDANVTVADLAKALSLSYQAVKKVVDGRTSSFTAANNSRAAQALKVNSNWLATGECERNQSARAPADDPDNLPQTASDRQAAVRIHGYSVEGLALAWLLDQVKDKLDKKKAEAYASAIILDYINQPFVQHKITPETDQPHVQPKRTLDIN